MQGGHRKETRAEIRMTISRAKTPEIASPAPEARREARFALAAPRRARSWRHLDLGVVASRTVRQ